MWKDFRDFAIKGNVIDLAVGVIIGAAFGQIVSSLVGDIIMPPIGLILGGIDFSDFYINLSHTHYATLAEAKKAGAATINYGIFINNVIHFLIVAFAVFVLARQVSKVKKLEALKPAPAAPTTQEKLLAEIRDALTRDRSPS
jgi:large conductance mechanosensitive channel